MFITVTTSGGERLVNLDQVKLIVPYEPSGGSQLFFTDDKTYIVKESLAEIRERQLVEVHVQAVYERNAR